MQEIPDDGSWLKVCWNDASAPLETTVTKINVTYIVEHPDVNQLEVRIMREEDTGGYSLWNPEIAKQENRDEFGTLINSDIFKDTPSQGNWYVLIRDVVAGDAGKLLELTITAFYQPTTVVVESSGEGEPTSFHLPFDAVPADVIYEPDTKSLVNIRNEGFETFPSSNWDLFDNYSDDGKQYLWGKAQYLEHTGVYSGWPAAAGTDAITPNASTTYPHRMDSWMRFGPFNLSDAATAEVTFWVWRNIYAAHPTDYNDYIFVGASRDTVFTNFDGVSYNGNSGGWQQITFSLNEYVGESNVWVAWRFFSNPSNTSQGVYVDDIVIRKEVPGYVTVNGTLTYQDRDGTPKPARNVSVVLYEDDPGGLDNALAYAITNSDSNDTIPDGYFSFPAIMNWDGDADADTTNRNLDLYVLFEAISFESLNSYSFHEVRDPSITGSEVYSWETTISSNVSSMVIPKNLHLSLSNPNFTNTYRAMWILQDLQRTWEYVYSESDPYDIDPGSVTALWENNLECYPLPSNCNSFFYTFPYSYVFIKDEHIVSQDTVVHEAGHNYMYNMTGWVDGGCPSQHYFTSAHNVNCAWSEGWGHFLAMAANSSLYPSGTDACFDFTSGHCAPGSINFETLSNADSGDAVEGRVASALLDLYDTNNDGSDTYSFGFDEIARVVLQGDPDYKLHDFWSHWKDNSFDKHHAVRAIKQNTIDYNDAPVLTLPDWNVPHNSTWPNAFYLPNYVSDTETPPYLITDWEITPLSSNCGVNIDTQKYIDIAPITNWTGSCGFTVSASDTLEYDSDYFVVYVTQDWFADVPSNHWAYSDIQSMYTNGITSGCSINNPRYYCPNTVVDRGQMAVFLLRGMHGGSYTPPAATGTMFTDVPLSHPFAAWIEQLANEGITGGCGGGNYCPSNPVTRAQMAVFLLRAKHGSTYTPPTATGTMFTDVPISHQFVAWIEQLVNEGISSGCGGGNYCPNNSVTRDQMAVFLVNTFNLP